jgi:hypothetical protein
MMYEKCTGKIIHIIIGRCTYSLFVLNIEFHVALLQTGLGGGAVAEGRGFDFR